MNEVEAYHLSVELQQLLTADQAWHYRVIPKDASNGTWIFRADDSAWQPGMRDELEVLLGQAIEVEPSPAERVTKTLGKYYRRDHSGSQTFQLKNSHADDFLAALIAEAQSLGSSDIHVEVYEDQARVRMRLDGQLVEKYRLEKTEYPALINKVKIRANLDIAEKRLPQDGRIRFGEEGNRLDLRVSVLPTLHGEKVVLRLLSRDAANIDIETLGFTRAELDHYLEAVRRPYGMILISGPTGSGKTTTLYATLKLLNEEKRNILTVEDPIEYTLDGINQVQLKESIGLDFASALRTFLRQDPDIIMLGEIRDGETAGMAIRAALTGHLVLSTIHTNSAWGTISRLVDMGVPGYLLAGVLNTTVAQRLVRVLCPHCKSSVPFEKVMLPNGFRSNKEPDRVWVANGCPECHYTGYKGRRAVYEVIPIDHDLAREVRDNNPEVESILREKGFLPLREKAFELLLSGVTTADEAYPLLMHAPF